MLSCQSKVCTARYAAKTRCRQAMTRIRQRINSIDLPQTATQTGRKYEWLLLKIPDYLNEIRRAVTTVVTEIHGETVQLESLCQDLAKLTAGTEDGYCVVHPSVHRGIGYMFSHG